MATKKRGRDVLYNALERFWDNGSVFNCGILQKFGLDGLGFINNITTLLLQGFGLSSINMAEVGSWVGGFQEQYCQRLFWNNRVASTLYGQG